MFEVLLFDGLLIDTNDGGDDIDWETTECGDEIEEFPGLAGSIWASSDVSEYVWLSANMELLSPLIWPETDINDGYLIACS